MRSISVTMAALAGAGLIALSSQGVMAADGPGVKKNEVLICSYQPMTGQVSSYFRMGKGADAWFKHVNETGGVNGRKIKFNMVDDKYEPPRTASIVKRFVELHGGAVDIRSNKSRGTTIVCRIPIDGNLTEGLASFDTDHAIVDERAAE